MNRNVAHVDNLIKHKVSPALALFDKKLTAALKMNVEKRQKELGCSVERLMIVSCNHFQLFER